MKAIDLYKLNEKSIKKLSESIGINYDTLRGDSPSAKATSLYAYIKNSNLVKQAERFINKKIIGISYSSNYYTLVNNYCEELEHAGYEIFIDSKNMHEANWIISEFEKQLACQETLLIFLGEDYLKSAHCMYELYYCYFIHQKNLDKIVDHVILLLLDKTIFRDEVIDRLYTYWKNKFERENKKFYEHSTIERDALADRLNKYSAIYYNFYDIVLKMKDINMINIEGMTENEVKRKIISRISQNEI